MTASLNIIPSLQKTAITMVSKDAVFHFVNAFFVTFVMGGSSESSYGTWTDGYVGLIRQIRPKILIILKLDIPFFLSLSPNSFPPSQKWWDLIRLFCSFKLSLFIYFGKEGV